MSDLLWSEAAHGFLLGLPAPEADRVIEAVELFAATGRGFVRTMLGTSERRLYIQGFAITFQVEHDTIFVLRIRRSRRGA